MKSFIINLIIIVFATQQLIAAEAPDSISVKSIYSKKWYVPEYVVMQIGGGIGIVSAGVGWEYGRKRQWETDIAFGVVPWKYMAGSSLTLTLKQNYTPWAKKYSNGKFVFRPLNTGIYISRVISERFWVKEPYKYGPPYYSIPTGIRIHPYLGQSAGFRLAKRQEDKYLTIYYEISSNDLYLVSIVNNKYLSPFDILSFSFGVKYNIF